MTSKEALNNYRQLLLKTAQEHVMRAAHLLRAAEQMRSTASRIEEKKENGTK